MDATTGICGYHLRRRGRIPPGADHATWAVLLWQTRKDPPIGTKTGPSAWTPPTAPQRGDMCAARAEATLSPGVTTCLPAPSAAERCSADSALPYFHVDGTF